jgi:hypothetical protein
MLRRACLALCVAALISGCAPSFSPLYRDYDVEPVPNGDQVEYADSYSGEAHDRNDLGDDLYARIRAALADAGWTETESTAPNAVTTEPRSLNNWGVYRVVVSLDVVPVGEQHVRVLFHPARRYFTGGLSKIPYLDSGLRRALLPDLNEAFSKQGLYPIGTPRERDEEQVAGT